MNKKIIPRGSAFGENTLTERWSITPARVKLIQQGHAEPLDIFITARIGADYLIVSAHEYRCNYRALFVVLTFRGALPEIIIHFDARQLSAVDDIRAVFV